MILVRNVFQARFGKAGELARAMVEGSQKMAGQQRARWRVLTDLSGQFDTVVFEIEVDSLATWERARKEMFENKEWRDTFRDTSDLIESGRSEHYTIEGAG